MIELRFLAAFECDIRARIQPTVKFLPTSTLKGARTREAPRSTAASHATNISQEPPREVPARFNAPSGSIVKGDLVTIGV